MWGVVLQRKDLTASLDQRAKVRPTAAEILAHPSFKEATWNLTPTREGRLQVAEGRGGPIGISWEVHGKGDIKVVWVMGLGTIKNTWQRQTKYFGHDRGDKYSSLIFDNRGIGKSDILIMRYSTSEMAKDAIELFDHLEWTSERQLHVIGVSMGGMIAQEIAYLIPHRLASLSLISTAALVENTTTFLSNLRSRSLMFIPKSLDRTLRDAALSFFSPTYLDTPDGTEVPNTSTPNCILPLGKTSYGKFDTNFERFGAQELTKRLDPEGGFTRLGYMLQAVAAGWHFKSREQMREIGDRVGRERVLVLHGTADQMLTVPHGRKIIEWLQPGSAIIREGIGHVFIMEECKWHNELLARHFEKGEGLNKESNA